MAHKDVCSSDILDGRSCRPWEYLRWEKDLASAFKGKNLYKYLTGEKASIMLEEELEFRFELEEKIVKVRVADDEPTYGTSMFATPTRSPRETEDEGSEKAREEVLVTHSPGTAGIRLARFRSTTTSPEFYYRELSEHKKDLKRMHDLEEEHTQKINACLEILRERTSATLQRSLRNAFDSRDIPRIGKAIYDTCGPTGREEGIGLLDEAWTGIRLDFGAGETEETLTQRVEDLALDFEAYGKRKEPGEMRQALHKAMVIAYGDAFYAKWGPLFSELKSSDVSWEKMKIRVHAQRNEHLTNEAYCTASKNKTTVAAALTTSNKDNSEAKKNEEAKKREEAKKKEEAKKRDEAAADVAKAEADKVEAEKRRKKKEERLKELECWTCGQKGHRKADCPNVKVDNKAVLCTTCQEDEEDGAWTCDPDELMAPLTDGTNDTDDMDGTESTTEQCAVVVNDYIYQEEEIALPSRVEPKTAQMGEIALPSRVEQSVAEKVEITASKRTEVKSAEKVEITASKRTEVKTAEKVEITASKRTEVKTAEKVEITASKRTEVMPNAENVGKQIANVEKSKDCRRTVVPTDDEFNKQGAMTELSGQDAINAAKNEEAELLKKDATDAGMGGNVELSEHGQKNNDFTKRSEERTVDSVAYCDPTGNRDAKDNEDTTNISSEIAVSQRSDEPAGAQTFARCGGWEAARELQGGAVTELHVVQARQIESQRGDDDDASRVCGPQGRRQKAEQANETTSDAVTVRGPAGGRQKAEQVSKSAGDDASRVRGPQGQRQETEQARRREDGQPGQEGYILEIALKKYDPGGSNSGKLSVMQSNKGRGWFQVRGARLKTVRGPHWKPYDPGGAHARAREV